MPSRYFTRTLSVAAALALASCATPLAPADPAAAAPPAAGYDENPPADALLGMWTGTEVYSTGGQVTNTLLFRPDGTGLLKSSSKNLIGDKAEGLLRDNMFPLAWKYDGTGWWTADVNMQSIGSDAIKWTFRMTPQVDATAGRSLYLVQVPVKPGSTHSKFRRVE